MTILHKWNSLFLCKLCIKWIIYYKIANDFFNILFMFEMLVQSHTPFYNLILLVKEHVTVGDPFFYGEILNEKIKIKIPLKKEI